MPRRSRILHDGIPLHIVQRGHNREPCFFGEEDYHTYLHWLAEALKAHGAALHAYALMTNHVHLLVTFARAADVPKLLMSLGRRYVQYINRSYRRTGTLWDSRYKASVVQADSHLLLCQRYIELNPVRAAMVGRSVAEAFVAMYFFEAACLMQVRAQSGGGKLRHISQGIVDGAQEQWEHVTHGAGGNLAWSALLRKLDRVDSGFRH
jgi:REP element-mobilizing transposase RayT